MMSPSLSRLGSTSLLTSSGPTRIFARSRVFWGSLSARPGSFLLSSFPSPPDSVWHLSPLLRSHASLLLDAILFCGSSRAAPPQNRQAESAGPSGGPPGCVPVLAPLLTTHQKGLHPDTAGPRPARRQWPEVYDLCHTFCTLRESKNPRPCENSKQFSHSHYSGFFYSLNVRQNLIPRVSFYCLGWCVGSQDGPASLAAVAKAKDEEKALPSKRERVLAMPKSGS